MLLMCPMLIWWGFYSSDVIFFTLLNKSTYHFMPAEKLMRCLGVKRFLSETLPS